MNYFLSQWWISSLIFPSRSPPLHVSSSTFLCSYSSLSYICCPPFDLFFLSPLSVFSYSSSPQSFSVFPVLSVSPPPAAPCFWRWISRSGSEDGTAVCEADPLSYARLCVSMLWRLHNLHKSPHPLFGLLCKHNVHLSSIQPQIQQR